MKRIFLILPAFCLAILLGCESDRRTAQSEGYQEQGLSEQEYEIGDVDEPAIERTAAALTEEARQFVLEAAANSMLEVELGQLAQEKAQLEEIKEFGRMAVEEHRKLNQNLQNTLLDNPLSMPEHLKAEQQEKLQELQNESGMEFDKEYINTMVETHEDAIENFENMRDEVQDPDLLAWIDNGLSTLRQHLEQAKQLNEQLANQ